MYLIKLLFVKYAMYELNLCILQHSIAYIYMNFSSALFWLKDSKFGGTLYSVNY